MKKLAFVTSEEDPTLIADDRLAIAPLAQLGYSVAPLVWDGNQKGIDTFDAFVFRSCWNYHRKYSAFLSWIRGLEKLARPVFNPIETNVWNLNKKYLLELEKKGAAIPKTEWLGRGVQLSSAELKSLLSRIGSSKVVVKPAVSLNGHDTFLFSAGDIAKIDDTLRALSPKVDMLIQEYIPEIKTAGEVSLIFFNGKFSHAIRKMASAQEFRIHEEYGGTRAAFTPGNELIKQAQDIVEMVPSKLLSVRVDLVERREEASLIELEIIDPMLFIGYSEGAPARFAEAIDQAYQSG